MSGKRPNGDDGQAGISMSGVLAMLCGGGLLMAYWKFFGFTANFSRFERLAFFGVAVFLVLWGFKQLIDARRPVGRRTRRRANGRSDPSLIGSISWAGILLVLVGIELLLTVRWLVPSGAPSLIVVVFGVLAIVQGVRRIAGTLGKLGRRPQYRVALPRPGAIYLLVMAVLLVGSLLGHSNMLMLVFALMVGPFVLNGWITYSMLKRTGVTRRLPKTAIAGEPFTVDVRLENRKLVLASSVMLVTDRIENDVEELAARVLFPRVPARAARIDSYRVRLMQRGVYRFGPLHLSTRFPLGIVERRLIFSHDDELLVYPRVGRLTDAWRRGRSLTADLVDVRTPSRGAFRDEFHGMRDYRPGDSPRSIHWRTSVRRNELTVREYQQNRSQDLMLIVDLWEPDMPTEADRERVELTVSFAATLSVDHLRRTRDALLEVAVGGRECRRWGGRAGPGGVDSLLEMLALVEPTSTVDAQALSADTESRRTPSMRVLLLTTRSRPADLFDALRESADNGHSASPAEGAEVIAVGPSELAPYLVFDADLAGG